MSDTTVVLVVEDDDQIAELVTLYLERAGLTVERAHDGYGGVALAAEHRPALVVVDIGLPGGIDGLEVCRRLRAESRVPILVLTARGDERLHTNARPAARGGTGTGLGLAIVRELARALGGDATATEARSGGARLVVTLPLSTSGSGHDGS